MSDYDSIISSGAGGAPVAHTLVDAGSHVLMLEKGPGFRVQGERGRQTSNYRRDELFATGHEKIITTSGVANQGPPSTAPTSNPTSTTSPISIRKINRGLDNFKRGFSFNRVSILSERSSAR